MRPKWPNFRRKNREITPQFLPKKRPKIKKKIFLQNFGQNGKILKFV